MPIIYVKVDDSGKRPVSQRTNSETGKPEHCFGLNVWRPSIKNAWKAFLEAQSLASLPVDVNARVN